MNKAYRILRYDWPLHFVLLLTNWLPDNIFFLRLRGLLASLFFKRCGKDFRLARNATFYNPSKIVFGSHVFVGHGNWFCAGEIIEIQDEVMIGPFNVIVSADHSFLGKSIRYGKEIFAPITVGKGSWVSSHCVVTAGSVIGNGCLIAANSVVKGELPDYGQYAGSPARLIKVIENVNADGNQ